MTIIQRKSTTVQEEVEATPIAAAIPISEPPIATPLATPLSPEMTQPQTVRVIAPSSMPEGFKFQAVVDGIQFTATVPQGGVNMGEAFETMYPIKIKVVAPEFLNEGDRFEAEVDGIRFYATVPPGGVREGDFFEVLHPSVAPQTQTVATATSYAAPQPVAQGRNAPQWRTGLCDCCNPCTVLCCMALTFSICLNAQIMQRMNLGFAGCPRSSNAATHPNHVCRLHVGLLVLAIVCFVVGIFSGTELVIAGVWVLVVYFVFSFVVMVCVRKSMREHYGLPGACCVDGNCCDDFCVTYWCSCCSLVQMASHTHDPKIHPYNCCTTTGLDRNAPMIV